MNKKSLFVAIFSAIILVAFAASQAQAQNEGACKQGQIQIQVWIDARGFSNQVEVKNLIVGVLNQLHRKSTDSYCWVSSPDSGLSRKIFVKTQYSIGQSQQISDGIKPQLIRAGVKAGAGYISRKVPRQVRSTIRDISREYTAEPRLWAIETLSTAEITFTQGTIWIWKADWSDTLFLKKKAVYGRYNSTTVEFLGNEVHNPLSEIRGFRGLNVPEVYLGKRADDFVRLIMVRRALSPENLVRNNQIQP